MISFERDNDRVICTVSTDLPYDCDGGSPTDLPFGWSVGKPYLAELLCRYLGDRFARWFEKTQRDAYLQGYKDGRAKRRKAY